MNAPPNRLARTCTLIAAILLMVLAAAHAAGHLQNPDLANETEAMLLKLAKTYEFEIFGDHLTMHRIMDGFSWFFSIACAGLGLALLLILFPRATPPAILRRGAILGAAVCLASAGVGLGRWPIPPVIGLALAGLCLLVSAATVRTSAPAT